VIKIGGYFMKLKTKIMTIFAAFSLFFGTLLTLNNGNVEEVKAEEVTPTYDTTGSYAVIKGGRFYLPFGTGASNQIRSIRFTNKNFFDVAANKAKYGNRVYEVGASAVDAGGNELKTKVVYWERETEFIVPAFLMECEEEAKYDCVVYAPVDKIYAPTICEKLFSDGSSHNIWSALKSITFDEDAFITTNVTSMYDMFSWLQLETLDLSHFDGQNLTNADGMFSYMSADTLDLSTFKCPNLTNVNNMFSNTDCINLVLPTEGFAPNVSNTEYMFNGFNPNGRLESYDFLANLDTSKVTSMKYMFSYAYPAIKDGVEEPLDFSKYTKINDNFTTKNVENMDYMFSRSSFKTINLTGLDTSNVTNMECMFRASHLETISFPENFGASCTNMGSMFYQCEQLKSADLTNLNTQSATTLAGLFFQCVSLENVVFPETFDTTNVTNMFRMFALCSSLKEVDISSFTINSDTNVGGMFMSCDALVVIHTPTQPLPSGTTIALPSQFGKYANISTVDDTHANETIDILVEYFIAHWQTMRTSGKESGMCGTLVEGSTAQHDYSELLKIYDMASVEQKNTISNTQDTADGTTIGDTMRYLQEVKDGNQKTEGEYGIETTTQTNVIALSSIDNKVSLVVLVSVLSIIAISGYYVISKRKNA